AVDAAGVWPAEEDAGGGVDQLNLRLQFSVGGPQGGGEGGADGEGKGTATGRERPVIVLGHALQDAGSREGAAGHGEGVGRADGAARGAGGITEAIGADDRQVVLVGGRRNSVLSVPPHA